MGFHRIKLLPGKSFSPRRSRRKSAKVAEKSNFVFSWQRSWLSVEIYEEVWSFIDTHAVEFGGFELGDEALPDGNGYIFCCGDLMEKFGDFFVEEAVVHGIEDFAMHDFF
jgi:hypothetical protein